MLRFLRSAVLYEYLVNHFLVCSSLFFIASLYSSFCLALLGFARGLSLFTRFTKKNAFCFVFLLFFVCFITFSRICPTVFCFVSVFSVFGLFSIWVHFVKYIVDILQTLSVVSLRFWFLHLINIICSSRSLSSLLGIFCFFFFVLITVAWYFYLVLFIISHKFLLLLNFVFCLRFLFASSAIPSSSSCSVVVGCLYV